MEPPVVAQAVLLPKYASKDDDESKWKRRKTNRVILLLLMSVQLRNLADLTLFMSDMEVQKHSGYVNEITSFSGIGTTAESGI